jgi:hypothetical protein
MNAQTSRLVAASRAPLSRAQLSPLFRRAVLRTQSHARTGSHASAAPATDSLTPASPTLSPRLWNPTVLDRLQMPLSRIRE